MVDSDISSKLILKLKTILASKKKTISLLEKEMLENAIVDYFSSLKKISNAYKENEMFEICDDYLTEDLYDNTAINLIRKIKENKQNLKFVRVFVYMVVIETLDKLDKLTALYEKLIGPYDKSDIDDIVNSVYGRIIV